MLTRLHYFDEVFYMCICYLIYALQESIFSCLQQFFQSAVSSPPPAGIAHSPQVSKGMNVWGILDIKSCVLGEWCLEEVGIVVGLMHERCGIVLFINSSLYIRSINPVWVSTVQWMGCPSLTIQSRALYAVDLMLEWRDGKGEWARVRLSMGCHMCAVHESHVEKVGAMSSLLLMTSIVLIESRMLYQEYIRNKSMQLRILTVNDILQKWRSKTSRMGMVTILLFLCSAWIQLLTITRQRSVTDCDTYGRHLRGGYCYWFKNRTNLHLPSWPIPS